MGGLTAVQTVVLRSQIADLKKDLVEISNFMVSDNFRDLLDLSTLIDYRTFYDGGLFFSENKNLKVIDNSSEEILEAVKEMFFRIENNFNSKIDSDS